jgi:hypothetical protein
MQSMNLFICCPLRFTSSLRQRGGFANYLFFYSINFEVFFKNQTASVRTAAAAASTFMLLCECWRHWLAKKII